MSDKIEKECIICRCGSYNHMVMLIRDQFFDEYVDLSLNIHLSPLPFFKRLKNAFFYIFGRRSRYGDFDEVLLNRESVLKIQSFLEETMKNEKFK